MLAQRDRWMHEFVLDRQQDWEALRTRLEQPFTHAVAEALAELSPLLDEVPGARDAALALARFACTQSDGKLHRELAELAEFPSGPFHDSAELDKARQAHIHLAALLLTADGAFRKQVDKRLGFPADRKREKAQLLELIAALAAVPGLEAALATVRSLPPARYIEDDWLIVRACFTLLRQAAGELQVVFAEAGAVDFVEVAQIAQRVLIAEDGLPTDAALAVSDGIRHLLVDEFQDTSRRQHRLLAGLIAAWPERPGRTCFAVGDPMQSIYFFRDADAELFPRVQTVGLEVFHDEPLLFDFVPLQANFRTAPALVERLNEIFFEVFRANDGSGVSFSSAAPARSTPASAEISFKLHLKFVPQAERGKAAEPGVRSEKDTARATQAEEIVALIRSHLDRVELARSSGEKYRIAVLGRSRSALAPVAQALREAAIPFRSVDLEQLQDRPEVLDALALAHALLNPLDRVAWLGTLRAPWCGLSLDDLHQLTSADDAALLARPVPELLAERLPLLSGEGQHAAGRVLHALTAAPALRSIQPTASLGTWLESVWLGLGGADCVDATARANLDLLWSCLDRLPGGEQDLLGPGLDAALKKLTALPDPAASSEYGVQLMTIHKSKGLEFEVVIVPDLHASGGRSRGKLLSWLERGLPAPDDSGEITEFLIAPLQPKGADRGKAKEWVDRVYRQRELQEDRRILYVAATRAREELHLFARPSCRVESDGSLSLPAPTNSLLATAWPALEAEVRARFEDWKAEPEEAEIETIAAAGESNLLVLPSPPKPTLLRRLPPDYRPEQGAESAQTAAEAVLVGGGTGASHLYDRHEGGLLSRALGTAVHAFLEELARLRATHDWEAARAALPRIEPRIAAKMRAVGVDPAQATSLAAQALHQALAASRDAQGQWILSPHTDAASEASWTGVVSGSLRTVRVDRVFRAGLTPGSEGADAWWIVDYKTAHADAPTADLSALRALFAPQLAAYAHILRNLQGNGTPIRAALYYPRMLLLDWWEIST
jgi:ATP-dependent exoDNAse (exonuclease V) beta subunit